MSATGCVHLDNFKATELKTFRVVHAVFVVCSTQEARKTKVKNSYCHICKRIGPYLHACLHCVFFGCHKHIRDHCKQQKHQISLELSYGQVHCTPCGDYVYDVELDEIALENKYHAGTCKKRLFSWTTQWDPTEKERQLLLYNPPKRICITADSTIGLRGLLNLGATCFMNCIVQALMHTPLLRDYFLSERHKCKGVTGNCLVCELARLFQEFYNGARVPLALNRLLYLMWTKAQHIAGYGQQDAHEFFIATLDLLHQHCTHAMSPNHAKLSHKLAECPCIIDQIFSGGLQSDLVCQKCNGVSTTIDPIWDFSLDLSPATHGGLPPTSLTDCLELFTRAEHLSSAVKCSTCQTDQKSTKQFTMKTLPIVVSFHLKRFEHLEDIEKKISTPISFPETLDMTPYMSRSNDDVAYPVPTDYRYSLFAVINHIGKSIHYGHYSAYVRQQCDYWYKCNDEIITRANLDEVLDSEGYLLFYHKHILDYD